MQRLYFLTPDVEATRRIVEELHAAGVGDRHIHVLAREGTPLEELHEATLVQTSDLVPALERGAAAGGITGALAGLAAVAIPGGLVFAGGAVLGFAVAGAGFGSWAASMIGISKPRAELQRYAEAIDAGELLVLVDVPKAQQAAIVGAVHRHHPEAHVAGIEPPSP